MLTVTTTTLATPQTAVVANKEGACFWFLAVDHAVDALKASWPEVTKFDAPTLTAVAASRRAVAGRSWL